MTQTSADFKVGDNIVYPTQGAGRIVGIIQRTIAGTEQDCFEIELLKGSMKVIVPVTQGLRVGLRHITPAKDIPRLMESLNAPSLELPEGWTPRHRREQLLLSEGDIFQIANLVGTLARRDMDKPLSASERRILDDAKHMIVTETAVALGMGLPEATQKIDETLEL